MFKDKTMSNKKYRKLKNFLLKKHAKFADHIITLSQTVKQDIVEYWGIPEKKISVIYCPIDPIWFETIAPEKREKILAKHSIYKPFFLAVGTLQPRKNFLRIIEAFEKIDKQYPGEFALVIVGKVGWLCDDIVSKIEKLTNKINIKWLKYIAHEDLRALYQSAMALVFPSLEEGFGYPIIEAFASKTQVITSNYGSMHEIAKGYGYLVNPSKVEAITSAMYEVINSNLSTFDKNSSILNAYKYTKKFNWENHISKLVNVYTRV
jgi:glycosyltransferase involved in cell wall biosynthesis